MLKKILRPKQIARYISCLALGYAAHILRAQIIPFNGFGVETQIPVALFCIIGIVFILIGLDYIPYFNKGKDNA